MEDLQHPSIRTVVGVLSSHQREEREQEEQHDDTVGCQGGGRSCSKAYLSTQPNMQVRKWAQYLSVEMGTIT